MASLDYSNEKVSKHHLHVVIIMFKITRVINILWGGMYSMRMHVHGQTLSSELSNTTLDSCNSN